MKKAPPLLLWGLPILTGLTNDRAILGQDRHPDLPFAALFTGVIRFDRSTTPCAPQALSESGLLPTDRAERCNRW